MCGLWIFVQVHWYMLVVIAQCSTQQAGWSVCPWGWIGSAFSLPPSSPCGSVSFLSVQLKLWSSLASSWTIVVNIVFICFPFGNQNRIKSDLSSNEHSLLLASKYSECVVCIRVKPQQRDFAFPHLPISRLDPTPEGWPLPPLLVCFLNCLEPENYLSGFAQLESCG